MTRRQRGFTLIEVLITVGILVLLAGLALVGYKVVGTHGKTTTTRVTLESMKSMMGELQATGSQRAVEAMYPNGFASSLQPGQMPHALANPGKVTSEAYDSMTSTTRYGVPNTLPSLIDQTSAGGWAIFQTQQVMNLLWAMPRNKTVLGQLPPERLLRAPASLPTNGICFDTPSPTPSDPRNPNPTPPPGSKTTGQPKPEMLVDAWGNPLLYVPASGLAGVTIAGTPNWIVTSTGNFQAPSGYGGAHPTFLPGATGFWVSAGPDGDFSTGDDNVYSFGGD